LLNNFSSWSPGIHRGDSAETGAASQGDEKIRSFPDFPQIGFFASIGDRSFHKGDEEAALFVIDRGSAQEVHYVNRSNYIQELVLTIQNNDLFAPTAAKSVYSNFGFQRSPLYNFRKVNRIPVGKYRPMDACIFITDAAMAALADTAFHAAFETH
jgi:hypothetical protein